MGLVRRTRASSRDYAAIWDYVAQRNLSAANNLLNIFDQKLAFLSEFPGAGPTRAELRAGIHRFPVGEYILFYRPVEDGIELLRVLHGKRNLRRILRDMSS